MKKRADYLSWDEYFMGVALLSAQRSKDPNTQVGACIVNPKNKIVGVGYTAKMAGKTLTLQIGFCHPVKFDIPDGLTVETPTNQRIDIAGCDKQQVGQFAANVRKVRPPEPYNGKGIRYRGERVIRKAGKSFVSGDK